jgi:hypothetical protein
MIKINKKYKVEGTGPFTYQLSCNNSGVSFLPSSGTTTGIIETIVTLDDTIYDIEAVDIKVSAKNNSGCVEMRDITLYNPCTNFTVSDALIYTAPNTFTFPPNILNIAKYEWETGSNIDIVSGQNTATITIKEKATSSLTTHSIKCTVTSPEGCSTSVSGFYNSCSKNLPSFSVNATCGIQPLTFNGISFVEYAYKYALLDLSKVLGKACAGCQFNYSTIKVSNPANTFIDYNGSNLVVVDKSVSTTTIYPYTIEDTCGRTYAGKFSVGIATCSGQTGCYILPKQNPVTINCADINQSATDTTIACGATPSNPYYTMTSGLVANPGDLSKLNWSTFTFLVPTNNGNPIAGYTINSVGDCMVTPYGRISLTTSHSLEYVITTLPSPGTLTTEPFEFKVTGIDNCISDIGSYFFIHSCVGTPEADNFTECIRCSDTTNVDLTSYITLNGLQLSNIELDTSTLPTAITITADIANTRLIVTTALISGNVTFKYKIIGTKQSTPGTTSESTWATVTLDIKCAGTSQSVVVC